MTQTIAQTTVQPATLFVEPTTHPGFGKIGLWIARAKQRKILATLDKARLADIGVTPRDAIIEAAKPFWQD